jgi:Na+/melibiose symporter-like transporter
MEEQKRENKEELQQETAEEKNSGQGNSSTRSSLLWIFAGGYLVYTGYRLCKNVLDGVEGGSWGFFAAGAAFIVVGAVMLFVGGRNYLRREKEKRAEQEAQAQIIRETQPAKEKKTMSIADRARLAEGLDDAEETETQADTEKEE